MNKQPWQQWGCSEAEWRDWHWQVRNRIQSVDDLERIIPLTDQEKEDINQVLEVFRMGITPYYASLMDPDDPACPVRRQAVPTIYETMSGIADMQILLNEARPPYQVDTVILIVLFNHGPVFMYRRHCTRRCSTARFGMVWEHIEQGTSTSKHPVRDTASGGTPLMADHKSEEIIKRPRDSHVDGLARYHTPAVAPADHR